MTAVNRIIAAWAACIAFSIALPVASAQGDVEQVLRELNGDAQTVAGSESAKSYRILFDAYLDLSQPPAEVGPDFSLLTIHPGMSNWAEVSGWAESNPEMAAAIVECRGRKMLGLPYGTDVDSTYQQAGLVAAIGAGGSLRNKSFTYFDAIDATAAFVTAETYRLLEAGQGDDAMQLYLAYLFVVRQCCDRQFLAEKQFHIQLLIDSLSVLRDMMYNHRSEIGEPMLVQISWREIPFLAPGRNHLFMPEGDRVVASALIDEVFDNRSGRADPELFGQTYGEIQSRDEPLTRFGAARRWRMIASFHDSREASQERLQLIYDDWWRRWRVRTWDPILDIESEFDRTNEIRYAAVIYSIQNIEQVFVLRNLLVGAVDGTTLAAGLSAYTEKLRTYPDVLQKTFGQFARKRDYADPYDKSYGRFRYRQVSSRESIDTVVGRVWIEPDQGLLYSVGLDHVDDRGREHSVDGVAGDLVYWPPLRAPRASRG